MSNQNGFKLLQDENNLLLEKVYPYLSQKLPYFASCNFMNYMKAFEKTESMDKIMNKYYFYEPRIYYTLEFLNRYQEKCAGFCTMSPSDVQNYGSLRAIYQMNKDFHFQFGIFVTFEKDIAVPFVGRGMFNAANTEEYLQFLKDNKDIEFTGMEENGHPFGNMFLK